MSTEQVTVEIPKTAQVGDVVTLDLNLTPENGYVPHPLFDTSGIITFVLGWGNYLPGLHTLVEGMQTGESLHNVCIDAGWGRRRDELVVTVPKSQLKSIKDFSIIKPGRRLHLEGDIQVLVTKVTEDTITVDANPPLAGASYRCDLTVKQIESLPVGVLNNPSESKDTSRYQVATFSLGCFWGAQLAFARMTGVVGTKSGYTQGIQHNPTYEQVCEGKTRHREAVMVVYDPNEVAYPDLMKVALGRLDQTTDVFQLHDLFASDGDEESTQYRHGFYYHNDEQKRQAEELVNEGSRFRIELLSATTFYDAEEYHQHYLVKGGQSARKGAKETIRCFG
jgi:peptide-methionine (S)-S-oxide reductase